MDRTNHLTSLIAAILTLAASQASAIILHGVPVGIASGQTARVNLLNTSDSAIIVIDGKFFDSDGILLGDFRGTIDPGKTTSFDLNRDTLSRPQNRVQLYVQLEGEAAQLRHGLFSLEVFDNADGKTMAFVGADLATLVSVPLLSVVSSKTHGSDTFPIDLPLTGPPGVECRTGGTNGDHTLVFTFAHTLTSVGGAGVTSGTGSVSSSAIGPDAHQYVVHLTGVANAQVITVVLNDATDSAGNSSSLLSASMSVLIGDTTANGSVSNTDVSAIKAQVGAPLTVSNFRHDVTANGAISNTDVSTSKAQVGTSLP